MALLAACSNARDAAPAAAAAGTSSGGRSSAVDAAAAGGMDAGNGPALCIDPEYLGPLANCEPGAPGCFVYSDEWRVAAPPLATTCEDSLGQSNECGCEPPPGGDNESDAGPGGATAEDASTEASGCASGESCLRVRIPSIFAGRPEHYENLCRVPCASDTDCTLGQVCWAGECSAAPACVRDSDCTADACGHCTRARGLGHLDIAVFDTPVCAYEGFCSEFSCAGCFEEAAYAAETTSNPAPSTRPVHLCP